MATWLLKTEPSEYAFAKLVRDRHTVWSGVTNALALKHLWAMRKDDTAFIYHTGAEKRIVGLARVASDPYPDPKARDPKIVVVDLAPKRPLAVPVPLAAIKADARFRDFALVRIGRLSIMPVPPEVATALLAMASGAGTGRRMTNSP